MMDGNNNNNNNNEQQVEQLQYKYVSTVITGGIDSPFYWFDSAQKAITVYIVEVFGITS